MCGRFASQRPAELVARMFRTTNPLLNPKPSWNVAPTQASMVVRRNPESGERHLDLLKWGLVPFFTKDIKAAKRPINARSETAAASGMFRAALKARRALVPCEAFYEWKALSDGKEPYAIARSDGAPLTFAVIWEGWCGPDGEIVRTFAILTTTANGDMTRTENEDLPKLGNMTREALSIGLNRQADITIKSLLGALVTITRTVAELRGQFGTGHGGPPGAAPPPRSVAQLAVSAATAFGVFAWERHRELADAEVPDPRYRTDGHNPSG